MTFQEHFSPMPIRAMALVLTAVGFDHTASVLDANLAPTYRYQIQCCIEEWTDGIRTESNWDEKRFKNVYQWHIDSLTEFHDHDNAESGDPLEVIRGDLLHNAR